MSEATLLESVTANPKWAAVQIVELHQRIEKLEQALSPALVERLKLAVRTPAPYGDWDYKQLCEDILAYIEETEMSDTQTCEHQKLYSGSGGYYLICRECGQYWVQDEHQGVGRMDMLDVEWVRTEEKNDD
jgi:hypothetical protein